MASMIDSGDGISMNDIAAIEDLDPSLADGSNIIYDREVSLFLNSFQLVKGYVQSIDVIYFF